jgi:hypothetical protein
MNAENERTPHEYDCPVFTHDASCLCPPPRRKGRPLIGKEKNDA